MSLESSSETIAKVEHKIGRTQGGNVWISKKLLKQLVEEERLLEARRAKLSAELEALKKVDIQ